MAGKSFIFRFADVEVREREFSLVKAGEALPVEPKAFRVLLILLRNPQKLLPKEELLTAVWGDTAVSENSLARSIALLRRLLGDEARTPRFIETVATVGYRWLCKIEAYEEASLEADQPQAPTAPPNPASHGTVKQAPPRKRLLPWLLPSAGVLALCLAGAAWHLHRPLPPPRIADYVQLTHNGRLGLLGGTDGSRIYFTEFSPRSLAEVAVTGGDIVQIPDAVPGGAVYLDVSPDGSSALLTSAETGKPAPTLWSARLVGGTLRRLGSGEWAAFSPDGRSVAYTTLEGDLWIMASDGTGARKVGSVGGAGAILLAWSPDGNAIRFGRDNRIWEIASNGSNLHQLLPGWRDAEKQCCGHWTTDGKFFVFVSGALGKDGGQIWALDERRGLLRQPPANPILLTSGPTGWGRPVPSRDGREIFAFGFTARGELARYDVQSKQFQPFLKGISAEGMAFSRDGKSVAYVSYPDGILWKASRDGSNPVQLSQPPMYPMNPRWSPDGTEILFMDDAPSVDRSYIVAAEGGNPRRLLPEVDREMSDPNWSPDGKKIVFASGEPEERNQYSLRMLDLASGQVTTVPGSAGLFSPRWSPDGRTIAALTMPTSDGLKVFDTGNRQWSALVQRKGTLGFPAFSRDSQFLYYQLRGTDQAVYRVRVKEGEPERVVDLKDWHMTGKLGFWMGLDSTDAPLLLRDNGTSDLYALTLEQK